MAATQDAGELLTVDELALATGVTVRTTRYYASLGLLPPPLRRGRMAYYGPEHLARLELVRTLQDHGFTLAAIERYVARIPAGTPAAELAVQRAVLTAWQPQPWERLTRSQVEERLGRGLTPADVEWLVRSGVLRRVDESPESSEEEYDALPVLDVAAQVLDLGMPLEAVVEANAAVRRHMSELADELARVLEQRVLAPYRSGGRAVAEADRLERGLGGLRALTLNAIVTSFQRAATRLAATSLTLGADDS